MFYLGCAVWAYEKWQGTFYDPSVAAGQTLQAYAQRLTAIEGNTTFYSIPSPSTIQKWHRETPATFRFCLKFPRTVSHQGLLVPQLSQARLFLDRVTALEQKLGAVFLQLPPAYGPPLLGDLCDFWDQLQAISVPLAVEVRHPHWWQPEPQTQLWRALGDRHVSLVILDTRPIYRCPDNPQRHSQRKKPDVPVVFQTTASPLIVRFISHPDWQYNQSYLAEWQAWLTPLIQTNQTIYFFVHCPVEDHSPFTARRFFQQLRQAGLINDLLPWEELAPPPQQLSLF